MFMQFLAMHVPDGFLSIRVSVIGWALLIIMVGLALRQTRQQLGERQIPLMGILAACIFAAQMLNFPVAGGTSGHLLGGTLVAILLGPWAAVLVMTCVIGVQGLLFQDGGLLAMGFNVFNMGIVGAFIGYGAYALIRKVLRGKALSQLAGAAIGAWLGVVIAAGLCALELSASGTSPLNVALPTMVGIHVLIGFGEAFITVAALAFIRQTRPDLIGDSSRSATRGSGWVAAGLLIAIALAFASPLANRNPDGLDSVAHQTGFSQLEKEAPYQVLPGYTVPFIQNEAVTTVIAGVIGVLVVAAIGFGVSKLAGRKPMNARVINPPHTSSS